MLDLSASSRIVVASQVPVPRGPEQKVMAFFGADARVKDAKRRKRMERTDEDVDNIARFLRERRGLPLSSRDSSLHKGTLAQIPFNPAKAETYCASKSCLIIIVRVSRAKSKFKHLLISENQAC